MRPFCPEGDELNDIIRYIMDKFVTAAEGSGQLKHVSTTRVWLAEVDKKRQRFHVWKVSR